MGILKRSKDPRTAKLEQLASAKFGVYFALPAVILFCTVLSDLFTGNLMYIVVIAGLLLLATLSNFRKWKKLEKELNEESPISDNEKAFVKGRIKKTLILLVIIIAISGFMSNVNYGSSSSKNSQYEEVFGKDPNDWTKEDKAYVNNLFKFIDKHNEK